MAAAGDFNSASQQFLSWFQSLQGATFHDDIQIVDLRGQNAGRGISETGFPMFSRGNLLMYR